MDLAKIKKAYSILALILIILGLTLLFKPQSALKFVFKITGIVCILFGIVKLAGYFSKDLFQLAFQFDLILGIISFVIGMIALFKTRLSIEMLGALMGIFLLADAVSKIQTAIDAKRFGMKYWYLLMTAALTASVIGILFMIIPFNGALLIVRLMGFNLAADGILNLLIVQSTVKNKRRNEEWEA